MEYKSNKTVAFKMFVSKNLNTKSDRKSTFDVVVKFYSLIEKKFHPITIKASPMSESRYSRKVSSNKIQCSVLFLLTFLISSVTCNAPPRFVTETSGVGTGGGDIVVRLKEGQVKDKGSML